MICSVCGGMGVVKQASLCRPCWVDFQYEMSVMFPWEANVQATAEGEALYLHRLEIQNFMRIEALDIEANGGSVVISGSNGSGKTSTLDAIWYALHGASARDVPEPVHNGARRAVIRLDLGEMVVERTWSEKGTTKLTVTAADGSAIRQPQQLLDTLINDYTLDPVAFLSRRPQDQVDDVLAIAGVKPPVEAVEKITDERHAVLAGESAERYLQRLSGDDTGTFFVRRREAHRTLAQKKASLTDQEKELLAIGGPPEGTDRSASSILTEIQRLQTQQEERRRRQQEADDAAREVRHGKEKTDSLKAGRGILAQKIEELKRQLEKSQAELVGMDDRIAKGDAIVAELAAEHAVSAAAVEEVPDTSRELATCRQQLLTVEKENKALSQRRLVAQQVERLDQEAKNAVNEHELLGAILTELRDLRRHLLDGVDLGVQGLEIGAGELRLNGVPFRQASQAEQIRTAAAVAMRQKPRIRLMRVDDGEHLDSNSRTILIEEAKRHGFQLFMTIVKDVPKLEISYGEAVA